ncbi:MAG TPA: hypothetical protein VGF48_21345 [Thermoanaerobaculia bacterium]|jgi:hypothetical protein
MATPSYSNDTVIVVLDRKCAKQVLLALTLALGGTPVKTVVQGGKKGKGGKSGGGKASTSTGGGKASTSTGGGKASTKGGSTGGKLSTSSTTGGATAKKKK